MELRVIPGYSKYSITRDGKVYNNKFGRFLKGNINKGGYVRYSLMNDENKPETIEVQRLMAFTWLEKPTGEDKYEVLHLDDNPLNNNIENLKWGTHQENMAQCAERKRNKGIKLMNKYKYTPRRYLLLQHGVPIGYYNSYKELTEITGRCSSCLYNIMIGLKDSKDGYKIMSAEKQPYACGGYNNEPLCYWYN